MARISQDQAQERHAFLLDLFRNQPDISRNEAMEAYKDKFGASLNAKTFNELREQALSEAETDTRQEKAEETPARPEPEPETPSEEESASPQRMLASSEPTLAASAQPAKKPKAKGNGAKNIFVDSTQENLQFLERVVQQLQEAGANNVRIDHSTERWMVLTVDTK